ncbi:hypothetical protein HOL21_01900 [Candidatus Woesearchaeota archaeon]|jgi:GTPase|nr:hypothetical protein [Candidatus Woesearchaeota archaeon]MBT5396946.1 hypothetical protein [Candidatus Woesearchaeota archaeon]MBT5924161.1 hypothetical protein [Candidatus Woesearchaeota archaeon]MBT6367139.1 hypothetical protein [Candidatus Woesearchaeota archaeon]MBT7762287.1 hypothetical protein [Candidatus Woesearchaeota archaeon]
MAEKPRGKVTHYYDKIGVAVVLVDKIMRKGDKVQIGKRSFFKQKITSMQINKERVDIARKGKEIGLKVKDRVRVGDRIFKIE